MVPLLGLVDTVYHEPLRPQFHFTAKSGWLNDPNGLVYYKGEYHMFFQHNPFGTNWGNMTWGHAVSKDLLHWTQLKSAIEPDTEGTIFSGSAVVEPETGKLLCFYTAAGGTSDASKGKPFTQWLASSTDGRSFAKETSGPVVKHIINENRDPKVVWDADRKQWVMALYLDANDFALFSSTDLLAWTKLSSVKLDGASECPDFYPITKTQWVFTAANGKYQLGAFDGTIFKPSTGVISTHFGNTGYAGQTFFNDPKGRRIFISWLNNSNFPNCAWNQQMSVPMEVSLVTTVDGPRLSYRPVDELRNLRLKRLNPTQGTYSDPGGLYDFSGKFAIPKEGVLSIQIGETKVEFNAESRKLTALEKSVDLDKRARELDLRILVDRASIEIFAQQGTILMPLFKLQDHGTPAVRVNTSGAWKPNIDVWSMKGIW